MHAERQWFRYCWLDTWSSLKIERARQSKYFHQNEDEEEEILSQANTCRLDILVGRPDAVLEKFDTLSHRYLHRYWPLLLRLYPTREGLFALPQPQIAYNRAGVPDWKIIRTVQSDVGELHQASYLRISDFAGVHLVDRTQRRRAPVAESCPGHAVL